MRPGEGRPRGRGAAPGPRAQLPARPGGAAGAAAQAPSADAVSLGPFTMSRRSLLAATALAAVGLVLAVIVFSSFVGGEEEAGRAAGAAEAPSADAVDKADLGAAPGAPPGFGDEETTATTTTTTAPSEGTEEREENEPAEEERPRESDEAGGAAPPADEGRPAAPAERRDEEEDERAYEPAGEVGPPPSAGAQETESPVAERGAEPAAPPPEEEEPAPEEDEYAEQYAEQYAPEEEVAGREEAPPPPADLGGAEEAGSPSGPEDKTLALTVPKMSRLGGVPVVTARGDDAAALDAGVVHVAGTGYPWEPEANVYMAGHRLGYINTGSFLVFYDLDKLREGDEVRLADAEGREYLYRVYDVFTVSPEEADVMQPVEGKNILTLQTCTLPDYTRRLIVRAEKVA